MKIETWLMFVTAIAQCTTVVIIYWEWEGHRLDKFLEDVAEKSAQRKEVFAAYCGLEDRPGMPRNEQFIRILENSEELRDACEENIRLFSRVGARLPLWPPLRATALKWHVVVLFWEVVGPYVIERRRDVGPAYAESFLEYAKESLDCMLTQNREHWMIIDPDRTRRRDVTLKRSRIAHLRQKLKECLDGNQRICI